MGTEMCIDWLFQRTTWAVVSTIAWKGARAGALSETPTTVQAGVVVQQRRLWQRRGEAPGRNLRRTPW